MQREGWKVNPSVKLPDGYELHEDAHNVYLYTEEELVGVYNTQVTEKILLEDAIRHQKRAGRKLRQEAGFTVIELVVVFALILLIIGISFPIYNSVKTDAQETAFDSQVRALEQAAELHILSGGGDVIWSAMGGQKAGEVTAEHETWMNYFEEWPENPLDTGQFVVEIEDGQVTVSPGRE